jgi:RNA polymerase sigma-70 factor (ECF subfamily)
MWIRKTKTERSDKPDDFEYLVKEDYHRLYRSAWLFTRNHDDAQDVVQETLFEAYKSFSSFKGNSSFFTWLYAILRNIHRRWLRKNKIYVNRKGNIEEGILEESVNPGVRGCISLLERTELDIGISNALGAIPEKYSEILMLRHFEDFSYKEIAYILSCSIGTVKSRMSKARELLRKRLR